jgi:hypothetical protein
MSSLVENEIRKKIPIAIQQDSAGAILIAIKNDNAGLATVLNFTIQNKSTTDTAYWSVWIKGGRMEYDVYDRIFSKFFDVLSAGVGLT